MVRQPTRGSLTSITIISFGVLQFRIFLHCTDFEKISNAAFNRGISHEKRRVAMAKKPELDQELKNKAAAVEQAVVQIEKQHGKGAIMRLGNASLDVDIPVIPTGSISLDMALGVGGLPKGRIVEIYGPESSGKTTLALHAIANVQKAGGIAVLIDAEYAFDALYAKNLGVDIDNLLVSQPDTGEQALEIADTLVRSGAVDIIVIDSVAALVPAAEIEGDMGDSHMGLQARLMSQALRKLTGILSKSKTCLIFINQLRMKIGVMFGNPETTTGGNALKFYSSVRIDIRRIAAIKDGDNVIGNRTRAKVVKNKVAPPFRDAEFDILYGKGISYAGDIIDLAVTHNIIEKSGAWLSFGGERLGQGRDFIEENKDVLGKIEKQLHDKLKTLGKKPLEVLAERKDEKVE
jgi:recombination protein RecA